MARLKSKFAPRVQTGTSADDPTDPYIVNQATALHNDPQQIFTFVRDQIGYQAYSGSLRGARGTLWSKAGNALDRASLLVALLGAAGFTAQYVQGTLTTAQAQSLILAMFQAQYRVLGCTPAGSTLADPANDPNLLAIVGDHYWVQYSSASGGTFTNADTAFPGAQLGQTFGTATNTSPTVPLSEEIFLTFSEDVEIFSQANATQGGPGLTTNTVLSQDFLTTDLIGKPVTIGQFVNSVNLGLSVSSSTNTYSPYLIVGGDPANPAGDQLIRGSDFQEVLTNLPLGSQVLTGVVAHVTITVGSSSTSQTFDKTLFDRIGFAVRAGGSTPQINISPGTAPALNADNLATFNVLGSLQDESIIRTWSATDDSMLATLKTIQPQLNTTGTSTPTQASLQTQADTLAHDLMINAQRILAAQFAEASDNLSGRFALNWYVAAYQASPRLLVATSRVTGAGSGSTLQVGFDTLKDDIQVVLPPGQTAAAGNAYLTNRGLNESYLESQLLAGFAASQTPIAGSTSQVAISAADLFVQAANQGIGGTELDSSNIARLGGLNLSADAKARITQAVTGGDIVFVPNTAVTIKGILRTGWVEFQTDGTATGVLEDGSHGALLEYTDVVQLQSALIVGETATIDFFVGFSPGWALGMIASYIGALISGSFRLSTSWQQDVTAFSTYLIDTTVSQLADELFTNPLIGPGFQPGLSAAEFGWTIGSAKAASGGLALPPALFGGSTAPAPSPGSSAGVTSQVQLDPNFSVLLNSAQLPTVFDFFVTNTGAAADTFNFSFSNVPSGFTLQSSLPAIRIPAGGQAEIGVCATPTGQIAAPGTSASFSVTAVSSSNPAIQSTTPTSFTVPSVSGIALTAAASAVSTTAGTSVPATLQIAGTGNAPTTVNLTVVADPNLAVTGIQSPVTVNAGQTITQSLTLTPSSSALLNSVLNMQFMGSFGTAATPQKATASMSLSVEAAQALPSANTAPAAVAVGRTDLAGSLSGLGRAITSLVAGCSATTLGTFQNYANNLLTQISLTDTTGFFDGIFPSGSYALSQEIQNATCNNDSTAITDLSTVITNLGNLLSSPSASASVGAATTYTPSNVVIQAIPQTATGGQGANALFQIQVTNAGPVADIFYVYGSTDFSTTTQLPSLFGVLPTEPVIAPGQTFTGTLVVPIPTGTAPGSVPILIVASGQNYSGQGQASATVNVVANGLTLAPAASSAVVNPNSTAQVTVTNTGSVNDTFTLSLSGPGGLFSVLGSNSVALAAGGSQTVNIAIGNPSFAPFAPISLEVTGTSRGNAAVTATLNLYVNVAYGLGIKARFQPSSQNAPAVFPLYVQNTGSVEDSYTAAIAATTGSIQANLVNLDGTSTQQIPKFTLPGLATGQLYLDASGTAPGSVTVMITSLTDPTVAATATANICQNCPQSPIADAGSAQTVAVGQSVTLDGSASSDPNTPPLTLTYSWTLVGASAATSASITNATSAKASFTPDVAGVYIFQLTVSNGTFSSSANVTLTAGSSTGTGGGGTGGGGTGGGGTPPVGPPASLPPVAVAGKNRNVASGKYVLLDGSTSYDPAAYRLTYHWSMQSAPPGSAPVLANSNVPQPAFLPDVAGAYVLQLIVSNGAFSSPPSNVTITSVSAGNIAPNANAGNALNAQRGSPITADGSASYDPDKGPQPLTYSWQFTQVPSGSALTGTLTPSGSQATFTPDVDGAYTLTLTVSDGVATGTDTVVVTASDPNVTPNANAGKPRRILPNISLSLDGSASSDPDGDKLTYQWRLASSALSNSAIGNATSAKATFIAPTAGQYVARLDARDGSASSFQAVTIIVGTACDGNGDGLVNQIDIDLIASLIGTAALPFDPLDANGDGVINAADMTACLAQRRAPTTLTLTSSANPATFGQTITFTATLTSSLLGIPTGTVQFLDGAVLLGTVPVSNNQAVFSTSITIGDTHTIIAQYGGNSAYQGSQASITQSMIIPGAVSLTLKLTSSANPSTLGQSVTFTLSFVATGGNPTGTVQFFDGLNLLGKVPVANRKAALSTTSLSGGSHDIVAKYSGDSKFDAAQTSIGQVISALGSTVTLTASTHSVTLNQSIVFTAHVSGATSSRAVPAPTGQVLFEDNGLPAGTASLMSGTATLTLTTLDVGTHTITAIFTGDSNWAASHATVTVTVTAPALRLTSAATNLSTSFSADEIVSMFNVTGLKGDTPSTLPLKTSVAGVTVTVKDSAGATRAALLYGVFASNSQVNFVIPTGTTLGPATVTVTAPTGNQTAQITVVRVAPGIFTANQTGHGAPVGQIVIVHPDGSQTLENMATLSGSTYVATLIKLASTPGQVFLQLYGTGVRHAGKVTATISGTPVQVSYAAQQGTYPGLDQINLDLPKVLGATGSVNIVVTVDGEPANAVTGLIQ